MADVGESSRAMSEVIKAVLLSLLLGMALAPIIAPLSTASGFAIAQLGVILLPPCVVTLLSNDRFAKSFSCRSFRWSDGCVAVVAAPAAFAVLMGLVVLQDRLLREWGISIDEERRSFEQGIEKIASEGRFVLALTIVVLPALCEELLFRGFLQTRFVRAFGSVRGILYVAVLFGLMHQPIDRTMPMILFGVFLGFIVLRTGSVWTGVLVHAMNNGIIAALSSGEIGDAEHLPSSAPLLGLAALILIVGYLAAGTRR